MPHRPTIPPSPPLTVALRVACTVLALTLATIGCAATPRAAHLGPTTAAAPPLDPKANLTLSQVPPAIELPAPWIPASEPAQPPVEALVLYGQARDALVRNQPNDAINVLTRALRLDPDSFDVNNDLAQAYLLVNPADDRGLAPLRHAAELHPDDIGLQTELGRVYAARGDLIQAALHLRYATLTTDYHHYEDRAALVDFFLGHVMEEQGYLRAALQCYVRLVDRLGNLSRDDRANPELAFFVQRPELLLMQIAGLQQRLGQYDDSLATYEQVEKDRPDDPDVRRQVVILLVESGRLDEAAAQALEGVRQSNASPDSIELLRLVWRTKGNEIGAADALGRLYHDRPGDIDLLLARAQLLVAANRPDDAAKILSDQIAKNPDPRLIRRLVSLDVAQGDRDSAARLLVETTARDTDLIAQLAPIWDQLHQPSNYRPERLAAISFPPETQPARDFWIARLAATDDRHALAQSTLARATAARPPLRWAWRDALTRALDQAATSADKHAAGRRLADQARQAADPALADELTGLTELNTGNATAAATLLAKAAAGDAGPYVQLQQALADRARGSSADFERRMWKLLSDYPGYDEPFIILFRYYQDADRPERAAVVVRSWLAQDPQNVAALLLRVILLGAGQAGGEFSGDSGAATDQDVDANIAAAELIRDYGNDPQVLTTLRAFYAHANHLPHYADLLHQRLDAHPTDVATAEELIGIFAEQGRTSEAAAALDRVRVAVQNDPERLLAIAHLYEVVDRKPQVEQVLNDVLKQDPQNPGANNDLGFEWADDGKNLPRAETLIRRAVAAEPDNEAFLDSLGWVLYKQSRFAEARPCLEQAAADLPDADPIILDHLGDTLYRLNDTAAAHDIWQRALDRLSASAADTSEGSDQRTLLKLKLRTKLRQLQDNQPVDAAPVVVQSTATTPNTQAAAPDHPHDPSR